MAINAREKFINAIYGNIGIGKSVNNISDVRKLDSIEEIDEIFKKVQSELRIAKVNYSYIKSNAKIIKMHGTEYTCDNGIILLEVTIEYDEKGKKHKSRQIIVTSDYTTIPLVYITTDYRKRAPQQLFSKSSPRDDIFPEHMRNIEVQDVNICIDGLSIANFQTFTNSKSGVMIERCINNYLLTSADERSDIIKLCAGGAKCLEIIYSESEPIYAQFAGNHKVESAEYDPNSKEDAKKIEEEINKEVDAIASRISAITSQNKKTTEYVKK